MEGQFPEDEPLGDRVHRQGEALEGAGAEQGRGSVGRGEGEAVVLYCTEDAEIFEVADRVYVIAQGRISGELNLSDYDDVESFAADRVHLEAGG